MRSSCSGLQNWQYLYHIAAFKKYVFAFVVAIYLVSAAGIPIYLHYCGGALEKINYVIKGKTCCGGEEDGTKQDGCCKDENLFLKNTADVTFKQASHADFVKTCSQVIYFSVPFHITSPAGVISGLAAARKFQPPRLQSSLVISTSVLRI